VDFVAQIIELRIRPRAVKAEKAAEKAKARSSSVHFDLPDMHFAEREKMNAVVTREALEVAKKVRYDALFNSLDYMTEYFTNLMTLYLIVKAEIAKQKLELSTGTKVTRRKARNIPNCCR